MPITDPNEVHAWIRSCQDPGQLRDLQGILGEKIQHIHQSAMQDEQGTRYVQPLSHTAGLHQPPTAGPSPAPVMGTTTAEQAAINQVTFEEQVSQGRHPEQQRGGATTPVVTEGSGAPHLAQEGMRAHQVLQDVAGGESPLRAEARSRAGGSLSGGVQPSLSQERAYADLQQRSAEEGKEQHERAQRQADEQQQHIQEESRSLAQEHLSPEHSSQGSEGGSDKPPQPPQPVQEPQPQEATPPAQEPPPEPEMPPGSKKEEPIL